MHGSVMVNVGQKPSAIVPILPGRAISLCCALIPHSYVKSINDF